MWGWIHSRYHLIKLIDATQRLYSCSGVHPSILFPSEEKYIYICTIKQWNHSHLASHVSWSVILSGTMLWQIFRSWLMGQCRCTHHIHCWVLLIVVWLLFPCRCMYVDVFIGNHVHTCIPNVVNVSHYLIYGISTQALLCSRLWLTRMHISQHSDGFTIFQNVWDNSITLASQSVNEWCAHQQWWCHHAPWNQLCGVI